MEFCVNFPRRISVAKLTARSVASRQNISIFFDTNLRFVILASLHWLIFSEIHKKHLFVNFPAWVKLKIRARFRQKVNYLNNSSICEKNQFLSGAENVFAISFGKDDISRT